MNRRPAKEPNYEEWTRVQLRNEYFRLQEGAQAAATELERWKWRLGELAKVRADRVRIAEQEREKG